MIGKPSAARTKYDAQNLTAARIIAGDPARYPSPIMQAWARVVLSRANEGVAA